MLESSNLDLAEDKLLIYNLSFDLKIPTNLDMIKIFNNLKLNFDIPFCKFRDIVSKQIVYKINKGIIERKNDQYNFMVKENELRNWLKYKNYELENFKLVNVKSNPKCFLYKLKIDDLRSENYQKGEILKVNMIENDITFSIASEGKIYDNISIKNIKNIENDLQIGNSVEFCENVTIYGDLEITRRGKLNLNVNISSFSDLVYTQTIIQSKLDIFLDYFYRSCIELNRLEFLRKNLIENSQLSISIKMDMNLEKELNFEKLNRLISEKLYPLVYIQEEYYNEKDKILYRDGDIYREGIVEKRHIDHESKENYKYDIQTKHGILYNINSKNLIKRNKEDAGVLVFYYKKISNFEYTKPIKNF